MKISKLHQNIWNIWKKMDEESYFAGCRHTDDRVYGLRRFVHSSAGNGWNISSIALTAGT